MEKKDNIIYVLIKSSYNTTSDEFVDHECIMAFTDLGLASCIMEHLKIKYNDENTIYTIKDVKLCDAKIDWEELYE